ncbi:glutamate racemase [Fructilactobacillus frigidiflavus]|uniref:glutamate racemase n=1 Tax=Fructilactobacillus frigidiflavus TaxID=3242688 RepID=UPI003756980F
MNSKPIAFMDSGIGGLTVLKVALKELPQENMIYLGDEAHMPYGEKSVNQVIDYSMEIGDFFEKQNAKCMVVACNTATASALNDLQTKLSIPVVGVIKPGSSAAVKATKNGKIGIIGTNVTINSHAYRDEIQKLNPKIEVVGLACPTFIPLVEKGDYNSQAAKDTIAAGLAPIIDSGIDTLVLGCTHFPIIAELIQQVVGDQVQLIDPGYETVNVAKQILQQTASLNEANQANVKYFTTKGVAHFNEVASQWLNRKVGSELITPNQLKEYDK